LVAALVAVGLVGKPVNVRTVVKVDRRFMVRILVHR
jgi:hypothetical protein